MWLRPSCIADAYISLWDSMFRDRGAASAAGLASRWVKSLERRSLRAASYCSFEVMNGASALRRPASSFGSSSSPPSSSLARQLPRKRRTPPPRQPAIPPRLLPRPLPRPWQRAWARDFQRAFDAFVAQVEAGTPTAIDSYAAEAPEEFFAVATEYHFSDPATLRAALPDVAAHLERLYGPPPFA